ncbi:TonB-dependent siderophore receptor [Flavobacterium sp. HSC-61S13]|uniref:TonB-dependent receptor plug domain-containing protein n=1 Tax=Flavobacterium sp. HSC-61S13 TaxID=2910963 RepID=UPI00209E7E8F|nr:TonB-dependent receptor plug domain-containing protein [Flavobacterium sp. HSC-61S13]MCP1996505.1 hypothetical protein [Flavobacterium sp. HSC-61S13]
MKILGLKFRVKKQLLVFFVLMSCTAFSQNNKTSFTLQLVGEDQQQLADATVVLQHQRERLIGKTNERGVFETQLSQGLWTLHITHLSYLSFSDTLTINKPTVRKHVLHANSNNLQEVVITAKESKGLTSSSIIDKSAMKHLQPSSFSDLLELLPGGRSKDPLLNASNKITLREVGTAGSQYNTSSLGTSFVMDGIPITSKANLQYTTGSSQIITPGNGYTDARRSHLTSGMDMRSLSTDQIESVEIVRGIPSVEYGNLTSGLVKIIRKRGYTDWESRFKADGFSKLYYLGKGLDFGKRNIQLNVGADYLDAKPDPTNNMESYQRLTASFRFQKTWLWNTNELLWNADLDYTASIDSEKTDPDAGYAKVDRYKSSYHQFGLSNRFQWNVLESTWLKSINWHTSIRREWDKIEQVKWVQLTSATAIPINTSEGEMDGIYITPQYISNLTVDGQPLDLYSKWSADLNFNLGSIQNDSKIGLEWTYTKNKGEGQQYNPMLPPDPEMNSRPRSYNDIPASQEGAFYVENVANFERNNHGWSLSTGVRAASMLNLDKSYAISNQWYWDPRIHLQWRLPKWQIKNKDLGVDFTVGYGQHTMFPTLNTLYPDNLYTDFTQLNFFHNNPDYRRVNYQTYITPRVNKDIQPAINKKIEFRVDFSYDSNQFSVTFFDEKMNSGFRNNSRYQLLDYKRYDASGIDHQQLSSRPDLNQLPYTVATYLGLYDVQNNGSALYKKGIEFQFSSKRLEVINTRFTFNGAWFESTYKNSQPVYKRGQKSVIINGAEVPFIGLYNDDDGAIKQNLNTNLTIDTYVPKLGLQFSMSTQVAWFYINEALRRNGVPQAYITTDGVLHPYLEEHQQDPDLQWLTIKYSEGQFTSKRTPLSMNVNVKISKRFYNAVNLSMFVNRIFSYDEPIVVNGVKLRQKGVNAPYFGMEMNLNF